jgi:hypothetical protein
MPYQTSRQVEVAIKEQTTIGTPASGSGAIGFRINSGGLNLTKEAIASNENRRDGQRTRSRHGGRTVAGQYVADLSVGSFDALIAAMLWGSWDAGLTITEATAGGPTQITTTANTIVGNSGSWITAGLRVGDIIRLSNHATAANNGRNLGPILGLTATTITLPANSLTVNATPDTSFTITRPKKVICGTTRKAYTVEEREIDIDASELFEWCRVSSLEISMEPNRMATVTIGMVGRNMETKEGANSPHFTSPTYTTSQGLTAVEASIYLGSTMVADLTGLTIRMDRRAAGAPVVGSVLTPDVFDNDLEITGSITGLRQDFARTAAFLAETDLSLHIKFAENEAEPADFLAINVPFLTLSSSSKSEIGQDGPRTQTLDLMIGKDERGGAYDPTMIAFQTTAA